MKKLTKYRLIVYGGAVLFSAFVTGFVLFVQPGFAYEENDLCGPMVKTISPPYSMGFFKGEPKPNPIYERENAHELINACYEAQNISKISFFPVGTLLALIIFKSIIKKPEDWEKKRSAV